MIIFVLLLCHYFSTEKYHPNKNDNMIKVPWRLKIFSSSTVARSHQNGTSSSPNTTPIMSSLNQAFIIRLDHSNYLLLCTQMLNIVIVNWLKEMIDGSQPSPPIFLENSESTNPDFQIWQRHSRFVMCWIYSSLIENVMSQIIDLTSAFEIWSALEKFFFCCINCI